MTPPRPNSPLKTVWWMHRNLLRRSLHYGPVFFWPQRVWSGLFCHPCFFVCFLRHFNLIWSLNYFARIFPFSLFFSSQCSKHRVVCECMSALEKCSHCQGPSVSLRWMGFKCTDCHGLWHLSCYRETTGQDQTSDLDEDWDSGREYVSDSESWNSDSSMPQSKWLSSRAKRNSPLDNKGTMLDTSVPDESSKCWSPPADDMEDTADDSSSTVNGLDITVDQKPRLAAVKKKPRLSPTSPSKTNRNYCFICNKPQSRLTRHLKTHMSQPEVSSAFDLPENSKERKALFEKMRNKGNFKHNTAILQGEKGQLKVKRKPKGDATAENYLHCMHCQGLFNRKELWRHMRRCPCKPDKDPGEPTGRTRVLAMSTAQETVFSQNFSSAMWKILSSMKGDEIGRAVRNDLSIVYLAQSLYNRHGQDATKHEYMRQKLREVGRLLVCLRSDFSIQSLEEAIKPSNFQKVVQAVQKVAGFDEEQLSYRTPSLVLKLGHTLHTICGIIQCRALMAEDDSLVKSAETFSKLYNSKWRELASHSRVKFDKPATLPFTKDVQTLHQYLKESADAAVRSLEEEATSKTYAELAKIILAQIIMFNRRRAGEVSKMLLRSFEERDKTTLHQDVAMAKLEQKLCSYFTRLEIVGKRERKVVVLLTPCMVDGLSLLTAKRQECGVRDDNVFLFGTPQTLSYFRGQDCLRIYASQCGAKQPELLRSTRLRKHVATLSQILNLKHDELDQVADFLGHDIHILRDFYRLPVPTTQLAKISKLLLSIEKGDLSGLQGKSLDEIEIEDEILFSDTEAKDSGSDIEGLGPVTELSQSSQDLDCHGLRHFSCYRETTGQDQTSDLDEDWDSGRRYVSDSESGNSDSSMPRSKWLSSRGKRNSPLDNKGTMLDPSIPDESSKCWSPADDMEDTADDSSSTVNGLDITVDQKPRLAAVKKKPRLSPTSPSKTNRNYCFICSKPQSRLTRHLKTHMSHPKVSSAFDLPENSKERKALFEKMRNKGNFKHNTAILQGEKGQLKVKRKPKGDATAENYLPCMHCQGLFNRKELGRHMRRCPCKPDKDPGEL